MHSKQFDSAFNGRFSRLKAKLPAKNLATLLLVSALTACSGDKGLLDEQLSQAIEQNDLNKALIIQKEITALALESSLERKKLGELYLLTYQIEPAIKEFERAQALGDNSDEIKQLIIKALYLSRQYPRLLELDRSYFVEDLMTRVYILAANVFLNQRIPHVLMKTVDTCQSSEDLCRIANALVSLQKGDYANAKVLVEPIAEQAQTADKNLLALQVYAQTLVGLGKLFEAKNAYIDYLEIASWDNQAKAILADLEIKTGDLTSAKSRIDALEQEFPDSILVGQLRAYFFFEQKDYNSALVQASEIIGLGDTLNSTRIIAGISALKLNKPEQAFDFLRKLEGRVADDHLAISVLNALKVEFGYDSGTAYNIAYHESQKLTNEAVTKFFIDKDIPEAQKLLEEALSAPDATPKTKLLGALIQQSIDGSGQELLAELVATDKSKLSQIALAMSAIQTGEFDQAKSIAEQLVLQEPDSISGYVLQGILHARQNQFDLASGFFNEVLEIAPSNSVALKYFLERAVAEQTFKRAISIARRLAQTDINFVSTWYDLEKRYGNKQAVIEFITKASADSPADIRIALYKAGILFDNSFYTDVVESLTPFYENTNLPRAYFSYLGLAHIKNEAFEEAYKVYDKWKVASPQQEEPWVKKIIALDINSQIDDALKETQLALQQFPNSLFFKSLILHYNLLLGDTRTAMKTISQLTEKDLTNSTMQYLVGRTYYRDENFTVAEEYLEQSFEQVNNANVLLGLVASIQKQGRNSEAMQLLENYVNENPNAVSVKSVLGILLMSSKPHQSVDIFMSLTQAAPDNPSHFNNLGWSYYLTGDLQSAEQATRKALQLSAQHRPAYSSLVKILLAGNNPQDAESVLTSALKMFPSDEEFLLLQQRINNG